MEENVRKGKKMDLKRIYSVLDEMQADVDAGANPTMDVETARFCNQLRELALKLGLHCQEEIVTEGGTHVRLSNPEARVFVSDLRRLVSDLCERGWA